MEQELKKNGYKDLNPMFFWQFVLNKHCSSVPTIAIYKPDLCNEDFFEFVEKNQQYDFVFDAFEYCDVPHNVLIRFLEKHEYKSWVRDWNRIDYLLCDEKEKRYWMSAGLCGVKVFHNVNDLLKSNIHKLSSVERIDNWENTKNLLTK